jgi:hypothetical protein
MMASWILGILLEQPTAETLGPQAGDREAVQAIARSTTGRKAHDTLEQTFGVAIPPLLLTSHYVIRTRIS